MSIISDLFLLFARYPKIDGVLANFNTKAAKDSSLKIQVDAMTEKSLYPQVTDYVFATSEKTVRKRIGTFRDIFLFVDYGNVTRDVDDLKRNRDEIEVAVTIAKPLNLDSADPVEEVLLSDSILEIAKNIQADINEKKLPYFKLSDNRTLTPFFSAELNNSVGWTMLFSITGTSIL